MLIVYEVNGKMNTFHASYIRYDRENGEIKAFSPETSIAFKCYQLRQIKEEPLVHPELYEIDITEEEFEKLTSEVTANWISPTKNPDFVNKDCFSDCSNCGYISGDEPDICPCCRAVMIKG